MAAIPVSKNSLPLHGWLVLDKPLGMTSTQAIGKTRRILDGKKAGHAGTLDPLATGVLPIAFGEATKLVPYVMDGKKEYEFTVRWGEARATDDAEGKVTHISDVRPTRDQIEKILPVFTGAIKQTPPAYSAIKVDGQRAYDLARAGQAVELKERAVTIDTLALIATTADDASFKMTCSKGTYVRSLARDLSIKLGTYGYVSALRRTRSGPFTAAGAISLAKLEEMRDNHAARQAVVNVLSALDDIPVLKVTAAQAQQLRHGCSVLMTVPLLDQLEAARSPQGVLHQPEIPAVAVDDHNQPVAIVGVREGSLWVVRGFDFR